MLNCEMMRGGRSKGYTQVARLFDPSRAGRPVGAARANFLDQRETGSPQRRLITPGGRTMYLSRQNTIDELARRSARELRLE